MKPYTVSDLRENLANALDRAERGETVLISRRNRRFRLVVDSPPTRRSRRKAFFRLTDPQLLETGWAWEWNARGDALDLRPPRSRRPNR